MFTRLSRRVEDLGLVRQEIEDAEFMGDRITLHGQSLVNFGLASYLGLNGDERLKTAAKEATDRYGTSYSSSISYTSIPLYGELNERLATMLDAHVVIAPTTTLAHLAALPVLIRPGDTAVLDARVHASVQMAGQLLASSGVETRTSHHNDLGELESIITGVSSGKVWLLTDGVFSMDGDVTPAAGIHALLERYEHFNAYIDDAHGFSWEGVHGRGSYLDRAPWHDRLVVSAGLSKSFGATGGVVATRDPDWAYLIRTSGAPLVFGGPVPPAALGAGIASAEIHLSAELSDRQADLDRRIEHVNAFVRDIGLRLTAYDHTPIWFFDTHEVVRGTNLLNSLKEAGFYLNGAMFPVVPIGHPGIRFCVTNYHSLIQIESMLTCFKEKALEHFGETEIVIDLDELAAEGAEERPTRSEQPAQ